MLEASDTAARAVGHGSIGARQPDSKTLEAALLNHGAVRDCCVLITAGDRPVPIAFVVTSRPCSDEELDAQRPDRSTTLPIRYVRVSRLPRTSDGAVDEGALRRLPVVDAQLAAVWEARLRGLDGVRDARVKLDERVPARPILHVEDLVPSRRRERPSIAAAPSASTIPDVSPDEPAAGPPAISHGRPLRLDPSRPKTLAATLERAAGTVPDRGVVYVNPDGSTTAESYSDLMRHAVGVLAGLRVEGLGPGDHVVLHLRSPRRFFHVFWGCVLGGFVPVPTSPAVAMYAASDSNASKLAAVWQMLDSPLVMAEADVVAAAETFLTASGASARVRSVESLAHADETGEPHPARPDDVALMMLTSGSTGVPKGVPLTHRNLISRSAGSQQMNEFSGRDVTLNWMPLDHVAGLIYFHIRDVFLGARQIHVPTELVLQNPLLWLDLVHRHRATVTFAPNFAFGLVNECADQMSRHSWDLTSMRCVLNGAEAIVARTARRFLALLAPYGLAPSAIRPAWGMSETSSGVTYSDRFSLDTASDADPFVEVGAPIPGFSMRIVDRTGAIVSEGTIGRLQVQGATVTSGYYRRPDLTGEAFTDDRWFDTGDLAFIKSGRLTIAGREKDDIVINAVKYYCHEIESAVEEVAGIETSFSAACAVRAADGDTEELAIFVVPAAGCDLALMAREIRRAVSRRAGVSPSYIVPVSRGDIPKTAIGKIQRPELRRRFEAGEFNVHRKAFDLATANANTIPDWFFTRRWQRKNAEPATAFSTASATVVFAEGRLGEAFGARLRELGKPAVMVAAGAEFARSAADRYVIRPGQPDDYVNLLRDVSGSQRIDSVVYFWGGQDQAVPAPGFDRQGLYGLLYVLQSIAALGDSRQWLKLLVVSETSAATRGSVSLSRSPVIGLVRTVRHEFELVAATHVSLEPTQDPAASAAALAAELSVLSRDEEVAIMDGGRWTPVLERADMTASPAPPFKAGGLYAITGGMGGIAREVAVCLLREYGARLLLLGRRNGDPAALEALRTLAGDGDFVYEVADVSDPDAVRAAVDRARQRWGQELDGVLHLAGVARDCLLVDETCDGLADTLRAKVQGGLVMHDLVASRPGSLFVTFGSVVGEFGAIGNGSYACASVFADALATYQRQVCGLNSYYLAWSSWDDVGMSRALATRHLSESRGALSISRTQGVVSLLAALSRGHDHLIIGVDADSPYLRAQFAGVFATRQLRVRIAGQPSGSHDLQDRDDGGVEVPCIREYVDSIPAEEAAPDSAGRARTTAAAGIERTIAQAWAEVLQLDRVDVETTFFDLGGTSLLMAQVYRRLRGALPGDVSLTDMFRYPTVRSLGAFIQQRAAVASSTTATADLGTERGQQRRSNLLRRKPSSNPASTAVGAAGSRDA